MQKKAGIRQQRQVPSERQRKQSGRMADLSVQKMQAPMESHRLREVSPSKIPPALYELFLENDEETASRYGNDIAFLKINHAEMNE